MERTDHRIMASRSLEELLAILREIEAECRGSEMDPAAVYDATSLPTFGGDAPNDTSGIWSWDEKALLVGTCVDDMRIQKRPEACPDGFRAYP
jgi:hypothetical protein